MTNTPTLPAIEEAIATVEHPEIADTLVNLGMLADVEYQQAENQVSLTLLLPLLGIPREVRNYLINSLHLALQPFGVALSVNIAEMPPANKEIFFSRAREAWRG